MQFHLRPPNKEDLSAIQLINDEVHAHSWSEQALKDEWLYLSPLSQVVTESEQDTVVGFILIRECTGDLDLMSIGVAKAYQGKGLGKKLIEHVVNEAQKLDIYKELFLEVSHKNTQAMKLYESMGFQSYLVRKSYYADGTDGVCMKLKLAKT